MNLESIQAIVLGGMACLTAWATFKGKNADSHISDNQSMQRMFNTQAELIDELRREIGGLKTQSEEQTEEFNEKLTNLKRQNAELIEENKKLSAQIEVLTKKINGENK